MLTLGGRPLSVDLLMQDYSGHLFPGGFLIRLGSTHLAPLDWATCRGRDRGPAADRARRSRGWSSAACCPASWWRLAVLCDLPVLPAGACGPPSGGRWPSSTSRSDLPVPRDLGPAASAAGEQPLVRPPGRGRDRRGAPVPGTRGLYPVVLGFVAVAFAEAVGLRQDRRGVPEPPRRVGAPRRADRRLRGGAPRTGTDRQCLAGLGGGVGRARRQLPGPQRRPGLRRGALGGPGSEHHRHPDDLGGGSRLDRPRGGRGPHVVPLPLGCLGLAAAAGLHVGGRRPALRRSDRSGLRRGVGTDPALLRGHRAGARGRPRPGGARGDVRSPVP